MRVNTRSPTLPPSPIRGPSLERLPEILGLSDGARLGPPADCYNQHMAIRQPGSARPKIPTRPRWQSRYHGVRMTPEQFLALPEEKPYLEYIDGLVVQKPMPTSEHGLLVIELGSVLREYRRAHGGAVGADARAALGDLPSYRLPDVSYWAPGNHVADDKLPSVAVEIRSRSQTLEEQREKCRVFRRSGVEACWLIDPVSRSAELFEARQDGVPVSKLTAVCMPGFELTVADLFSALDEQRS